MTVWLEGKGGGDGMGWDGGGQDSISKWGCMTLQDASAPCSQL